MASVNINPITIDKLFTELKQIYTYNLTCKRFEDRIVPALWGPPGIGKTEVVKQASKEIDYTAVILGLSSLNPVDIGGFPYREGDRAKQARPFYFPDEGSKVNLFLDEINTAVAINQVTAFSLTQNGSIQDHKLPLSTLLTVAGNRAEDNAATHKVPKPLLNRLTHYSVRTSAEAFIKYGTSIGMHPDVLGFILYKPTSLIIKPGPEDYAFPTPRSWHRVSNLLNAGITSRASLSGTIGLATYTELVAYAQTAKELPDLDKALDNPSSVIIPTRRDIMYLMVNGLVTRLVNKLSDTKIDSFFSIIDRLPPEMKLIAIHALVAEDKGAKIISGKYAPKIQEIINGKA